jgi:S-adenosyl-L-methionine hydrolase (adenosine-forming)
MIVLFTDFGTDDIYVGQLKASLFAHLPDGTGVIDLLHSAPSFHVRAGAHLLAALQNPFPAGTVFLAVVDPGVGTSREAVIVQADGKWYVGPDNGLLSVAAARAAYTRTWRIAWRPDGLSASFHARDLFAPIAAAVAAGKFPVERVVERKDLNVQLGPDDLAEVIYIDHYGNAITGVRARMASRTAMVAVREWRLSYARVFADAPAGTVFWYENSIGLLELAADRASAAAKLSLEVGDMVEIIEAERASA